MTKGTTERGEGPRDEDDLADLISAMRRRFDKALARAKAKRAAGRIRTSRARLAEVTRFPQLLAWGEDFLEASEAASGDPGVAQLRTFVGGMGWWKVPRVEVSLRLDDLRPLAHLGLPLPRKVLDTSWVLAPDASAKACVYAEQALVELEPARPALDEERFGIVFDDAVSVDVPAAELDDPREWFQEIDGSGRATSAPHAAMRLPERERAANEALAALAGRGPGYVLVSWHSTGISAIVAAPAFRRHWGEIVRAVLGQDAIAIALRPVPSAWALAWHHMEALQIGALRARWPHRLEIVELDREPDARKPRRRRGPSP